MALLQKRLISFDVGIKNLAYCIFDFDEKKDEPVQIVQWNVLNLCCDSEEALLLSCQGILKNKKACGKPAKYRKEELCMCEKHAKTHSHFVISKGDQTISSLKKKSAEEIKILHRNLSPTTTLKIKSEMIQELFLYYKSKTWDPIHTIVKKNASTIDLISIGRSLHSHLSQNEIMSSITHVIIENQISPIANRMKTLQGMIAQHYISLGVSNIHFVSSGNKLKDFQEVSDAKTPYQKHKKDAIIHCGTLLEKLGEEKWVTFFNSHRAKKDDLADCFLQGIWYLKKKKSTSL